MWAAYSPVKNSPADARAKVAGGTPSHSATTGELDIYAANCRRDPAHMPLYADVMDSIRRSMLSSFVLRPSLTCRACCCCIYPIQPIMRSLAAHMEPLRLPLALSAVVPAVAGAGSLRSVLLYMTSTRKRRKFGSHDV